MASQHPTASFGEDKRDQQTSDAAVAIGERVDRFELRMSQCGGDERRKRVVVEETFKFGEMVHTSIGSGGTKAAVSMVQPAGPIQLCVRRNLACLALLPTNTSEQMFWTVRTNRD